MSQLIEVTEDECRHMLGEFYDIVAKHLGYEDTSKLQYDCTKIDVNAKVWNTIWAHYKLIAMASFEPHPIEASRWKWRKLTRAQRDTEADERAANQAIAMMFLVYGPKNILVPSVKEAEEMGEFLVEVDDGFILQEGQDDESCESV